MPTSLRTRPDDRAGVAGQRPDAGRAGGAYLDGADVGAGGDQLQRAGPARVTTWSSSCPVTVEHGVLPVRGAERPGADPHPDVVRAAPRPGRAAGRSPVARSGRCRQADGDQAGVGVARRRRRRRERCAGRWPAGGVAGGLVGVAGVAARVGALVGSARAARRSSGGAPQAASGRRRAHARRTRRRRRERRRGARRRAGGRWAERHGPILGTSENVVAAGVAEPIVGGTGGRVKVSRARGARPAPARRCASASRTAGTSR